MDTAQWPQGTGVMQLPMEGDSNSGAAVVDHQRLNNKPISAPRPQKPQAINCPRCNSTHTKFCYYNNYSLSQPRYFCKTCRRYWTEGGSLRSVPVGGGWRKNKRSSSSSSSILSKKLPHETIGSHQNPNIKMYHEGTQDLNLAYPPITNPSYNLGMPEFADQFPDSTISSHQNNFSQFLKSGISGASREFSSFMSMIPVPDSNIGTGLFYSASTSGSSSGLPFQEFSKTSTGINFSLNQQQQQQQQQQQGFDNSGNQGGYASTLQGVNSSTGTNHPKLFNFPFEDLKQPPDHVLTITSTTRDEMIEQNGRNSHGLQGEGDDHLQSSGLIWNNGGGLGGSSTGASW